MKLHQRWTDIGKMYLNYIPRSRRRPIRVINLNHYKSLLPVRRSIMKVRKLFIKQGEKIGRFKYFYTDSTRNCKHKKSWCFFIDQELPLLHKLYGLKLQTGKWSKVHSNLKKALNIVGDSSDNESLQIIYCGRIRHKLIWD